MMDSMISNLAVRLELIPRKQSLRLLENSEAKTNRQTFLTPKVEFVVHLMRTSNGRSWPRLNETAVTSLCILSYWIIEKRYAADYLIFACGYCFEDS